MQQDQRPPVPPLLAHAAAWSWRLLAVGAAAWALTLVLVRLRVVVLPVVFALFLATLLVPPTDRLRARGWPSLAATWVVVLTAVLLLAGFGVLLARLVAPELPALARQAGTGLREIQSWLINGPLGLSQEQIDTYLQRLRDEVQANSESLTQQALAGATLAVEIVTGLVLTLVLTFFIVKDGYRFGPWFAGLFPDRVGEDLRAMGRLVAGTIGAYLRGVAIVGLVDGVLIGIALAVLRVPLALPLASLTALGAFFPLVGAFTAGALAALVALVTQGFLTALVIVAVTVGIQQLEGHVLAPVVLGRAVKLHPAVILLALAAGAVVAGIIGAFLAVPMTAAAFAIGSYWRSRQGAGLEAQERAVPEPGAAEEAAVSRPERPRP